MEKKSFMEQVRREIFIVRIKRVIKFGLMQQQ